MLATLTRAPCPNSRATRFRATFLPVFALTTWSSCKNSFAICIFSKHSWKSGTGTLLWGNTATHSCLKESLLGIWPVSAATALVGGSSAVLTAVYFLLSFETHRFQAIKYGHVHFHNMAKGCLINTPSPSVHCEIQQSKTSVRKTTVGQTEVYPAQQPVTTVPGSGIEGCLWKDVEIGQSQDHRSVPP